MAPTGSAGWGGPLTGQLACLARRRRGGAWATGAGEWSWAAEELAIAFPAGTRTFFCVGLTCQEPEPTSEPRKRQCGPLQPWRLSTSEPASLRGTDSAEQSRMALMGHRPFFPGLRDPLSISRLPVSLARCLPPLPHQHHMGDAASARALARGNDGGDDQRLQPVAL